MAESSRVASARRDEAEDILLDVRDLEVHFDGPERPARAVDGVSFSVRRGETYALVGESGCGKSTVALSVLRLVEPGRIVGGQVFLGPTDLLSLPERAMRRHRGRDIGMVFQEAGAALNPVMRIGTQVGESLRIHRGMGRKEAWAQAVRLLHLVALPDPEQQARAYPHELSGGMKQRVMIAIALSCSPALVIADEPTSALDVTIQAQILSLLRRLREDLGLTLLLIAHDLGVVAENADRVGVMYAGRIVEEAPVRLLFDDPRHPYTCGLLRSLPRATEGGTGRDRRGPLPTLPGTVPDPAAPPPGCRFHPRCPDAFERCAVEEPPDFPVEGGRRSACFLEETGHRVTR